MPTILHIDVSARQLDPRQPPEHSSVSRALAKSFKQQWLEKRPEDQIIYRDLTQTPLGFINQAWITAVFAPDNPQLDEKNSLLALSDALIAELVQADIILISTPMYNYGMPASLKAWFDQVIRVNKTFTFDLSRGDFPLEPILLGKTLVLLVSCGEFGFGVGGVRESMNHLSPHIRTLGKYLGVAQFHEIRVEYQEFGDKRHVRSTEKAYLDVAELIKKLLQCRTA